MKKLIYAATVIAALFPGVGSAFVELQGLEPNPALVNQSIELHIRTGVCDTIRGIEALKVSNQSIDVFLEGIRSDTTCGFPIVDRVIPVGQFPIGEYEVNVHFNFDNFGTPSTETVGTLFLTVEDPQPVPVGRWWGFAILWLLVLGTGLAALRYKGREGYA